MNRTRTPLVFAPNAPQLNRSSPSTAAAPGLLSGQAHESFAERLADRRLSAMRDGRAAGGRTYLSRVVQVR